MLRPTSHHACLALRVFTRSPLKAPRGINLTLSRRYVVTKQDPQHEVLQQPIASLLDTNSQVDSEESLDLSGRVQEYINEHQISIRHGPNSRQNAQENQSMYTPMLDFEQSGFAPGILKALKREGFDMPTPIQAMSWPVVMEGKDVISVARTGSGKVKWVI